MFKICDHYVIWPEVDTHKEYKTLLKLIKSYERSKVSKGNTAPHIALIDVFEDEGVAVEVNDAGRKLLELFLNQSKEGKENPYITEYKEEYI